MVRPILILVVFMCVISMVMSAIFSLPHDPRPFQRDFDESIEKRFYTLNKTVINPVVNTFMLTGKHICNNPETQREIVVVLITSTAKDIYVRNILRQTWVHALKANTWPQENIDFVFKVVFLFGNTYTKKDNDILKIESKVYEDIVQGNFTDNYQNLTRKILFGLKWVTKYCTRARYVIRIETGAFVHFPKLLRILQFYDDSNDGKMFCQVNENSVPQKNRTGLSNKSVYSLQFYPPYCSGSVYVISGKAIEKLVYASERMPYLPLEDIFVTGIVAKMAFINRINILPKLDLTNKPEWECSFQAFDDNDPMHVAEAGYSPRQIKRIWKCLEQGPDLSDYFRLIVLHTSICSLTIMAALVVIVLLLVLSYFKPSANLPSTISTDDCSRHISTEYIIITTT